MNTKLTIKPKRFSKHKYIFALQVSDSVKSCLERVFSVTQTNLLHTRHVCHITKKKGNILNHMVRLEIFQRIGKKFMNDLV